MDILKGEIKIYSINDDEVYEVDFMNLVVIRQMGLRLLTATIIFASLQAFTRQK